MESQVIALRREDKSTAEIAKTTGVSYYRQRQIYDAHNVPTPSRYGQTRRRILAMLNAGEISQSEIARTLGVSRQLVSEVKLLELTKKGIDSN